MKVRRTLTVRYLRPPSDEPMTPEQAEAFAVGVLALALVSTLVTRKDTPAVIRAAGKIWGRVR